MSGNQNTDQSVLQNLIDWRFLVALLGLAINDHWAKAAFPGMLTGKLSDLAGMVVLPVILSVLWTLTRGQSAIQQATRRLSLLISGVFLTAIKIVPVAASLVEGVLQTITGFRQEIIVDPTDLVGLAALAIAHRVIRQPQPIPLRRLGQFTAKLALGVAILAMTATSSETDYGLTRLEVQDDQIIASTRDGYGGPISSSDGGRTWDRYQVDVGSTQDKEYSDWQNWNPEQGPVCLSARPDTCIRLVLGLSKNPMMADEPGRSNGISIPASTGRRTPLATTWISMRLMC